MFSNFNLLETLTTLPGILLGFTLHEFAHAYMADRFGDPTPGNQGRLTLNPFAHIDIFGLIMIIFAGFGWAKPVQTSPSRYRGNIRQKDIIVSIAGPVANLLIAFATGIVTFILIKTKVLSSMNDSTLEVIEMILTNTIWINCVLFIFNLVPIPPLDGFHVLSDLLPSRFYNILSSIERYSYIILLVFILSPASDEVIVRGASFIMNGILSIIEMAI